MAVALGEAAVSGGFSFGSRQEEDDAGC